MILQKPRKIIYRYKQKARLGFVEYKACVLKRGHWGLKVIEAGRLTFAEVDAARKIIQSFIKLEGFLNFNIAFSHPLTHKALGSRMGKGKSIVSDWVVYAGAGTVLLELINVSDNTAKAALRRVQDKFSVKTKIIKLLVL